MAHEWTVRGVLEQVKEYFRHGCIEAARLEAETLAAHALNTKRLELYAHPDRVLSETEYNRLCELVRRRFAGEPLQYLIGHVDFYNSRLNVAPTVLIPRSETEELVERIVADFSTPPERVLDLGTGSGAIAIALAKTWPQSCFVAVDLSIEALSVARENAQQNGVLEQIELVCSDWFSNVQGTFGLIVSNPPYIAQSDLAQLPREVRHEPHLALDGGEFGLSAIARITQESPQYLQSHGCLYLEIGSDQGTQVRELFAQSKAFKDIEILKDLAGRERFARAIRINGF